MNDAKSLYCTNPMCQAKESKSFALFVSRDALNIDGLSEGATLEKFIARGFIPQIQRYLPSGFLSGRNSDDGRLWRKKSYTNLIASVDKAEAQHLLKWYMDLGLRESVSQMQN